MIQARAWPILLLVCILGMAIGATAETFEMVGGATISGEPISANPQGVVVKREDGSFAPRVPWTNFTQNALKQLAQNPKTKVFAEGLLEAAEEESPERKKAAEITLKPVSRLDRPDPRAGLGALFRSPLSIVLLLLFYAANIYAGYEISIFRNYPAAAVCAAAAILPVAGPVLFLCLPRRIPKTAEETTEQLAEEHQEEHLVPHDGAAEATEAAAAAPEHHAAPAGPSLPAPIIYQRGHFSFNRRFFETKMPGFLRMIPSEAEKDMVLLVKSSRGEYLASRIARLTPNEIYVHVVKAGASNDVMIPYTELAEVQIRHKDLH
jgi:hypothetical protein